MRVDLPAAIFPQREDQLFPSHHADACCMAKHQGKGPRRQAGGGLEWRHTPGRRERRRGIGRDQNL